MQLSSQTIKQTVLEIMPILNSRQFISDSQAKQLFSKLIARLQTSKTVHKDQANLVLRTFIEIQRKIYNFSIKHLPEIWKSFIHLYLKIYHTDEIQSHSFQVIIQNLNNAQDLYNYVSEIKHIEKNKVFHQSPQNFVLLLTLWQKLFSFSDLKTIQYAFLSLALIFIQNICHFNLKNAEIHKFFECIDKMSLYNIKYNQKIKDLDNYESFNKVLERMQSLFHENYDKEITKAIKQLHQSYKLSQVLSYSDIFLNTWEKLILARILCLSKKKSIDDIQTVIKLLGNLKKTFFLERTINYSRMHQYKSRYLSIVSPSLVEFKLFCTIVQIWVNFKIVFNIAIVKEQNCELKTKLLQDQERIKNFLKQILQILTKRQINILMMRQLVKNLRIINVGSAVTQWKQVFSIMQQILKSYHENKGIIQFTDQKSYISKNFSPFIKYPFAILLKIKGQSIPFKQEKILIQFIDSSSKQKIIITMRNYEKSCMIFSFVKVVKNNIWGKEQRDFQWLQYQVNTIEIVLKSNKIKMFVNNQDNMFLSMQNSLGKVDEMVLCDRQTGMGSTITQLLEFKVIQYNTIENLEKIQVDLVKFICPKYSATSKDSMKENLKFYKCQQINQESFMSLMQSLGDLQLFMVILYHALKKIKNNEDDLLQMIRLVLKLMQDFTMFKNVQLKQLTVQEKQARRKTIQCLGWFFAKQSKSVFVIFELMRFLYIRGNRNNNEILTFLCNFSYWKQFSLEKQLVIVMKIKELLKQASKQEQKISNLGYCKLLLFDMILYFKQTGYKMCDKQSCLRLHQAIIQIVYQQIRDIIELNNNNRKVKLYMLEIFNFLEYIINLISCLVNRKVHEDTLDLTLTVELTMLLRDLAKLLFVSKQKKFITKQQIDFALQQFFKKQQQNLILPLSLNAQQACDQRFTMYLSNILSQSKSLITLFDTEMTLFQQTQIKFYPIYADTPSICTQNKIHSNIVNFGIYLSMLSQKSWNYILFGMPLEEYSERFCQSLWRISFYQLFKQKKYFTKVCKMLQNTPLPTNQYCLMKIFEAVLLCPYFQKQHLFRIVKSGNFTKSICPFKIHQLLIKYSKKFQSDNLSNKMTENLTGSNSNKQMESVISLEEGKIYYVLLNAQNVDFDNCQGIIQCLKSRKSYNKYKIIIYEVVLRSLIRHIQHKRQRKKLQRMQTGIYQSSVIGTVQRRRSRLYSNDQTQLLSANNQNSSTVFGDNKIYQKELTPPSKFQQNLLLIKPQLTAQLINALQFYQSAFTIENMRSFFNLNSTEDLQALKENFIINVEGMIKALQTHQTKKTSIELEKYLSFIQVYLKKFSQHLISQTFSQFKTKNQRILDLNNDEGKKGRTKILYRTVYVDLIKNSTQFFLEQINQRRRQLHNLQHSWSLISQRHTYFWNLFISSQKYYSLSDITTYLGERYLLKISTEKPKIDLPKMMNKYSLIFSVSLLSDKNENIQESQPSTLFDDCDELLMTELEQVEAKTKEKVRKGSTHIVKEIKTRKFRVLLVTNTKIYQGLLFMPQRKLLRFQEIYPIDKLYDKICANEQQKRNDDEVEKQPMSFDILLDENSKIMHRKYLFFDTAIEVFSNERSSFFCFDNQQKRNRFCSTYLKDMNVLTYEMNKKIISQQTQKWTKGLVSNYEYLMKLNQFANRSVNDLSQYFVMPWTVGEFEQNQVDRKFLNEQKYFRDLTKPLGKLFDKKWKEIENRFKMSYNRYNRQEIITPGGIQPFLYGSFYSNPAIVTNYMIRLQPFSSLHYHLQSQKIDLADRLFFQVSDQYLSLSRNLGDMKQLIPQFYNNSQFLKNKSRLNLGARQNKEIVNDVRLPKWASNAQQFIFKMRYFLESPIVSKYLNVWIDLIFGVKAKRQNAMKADNLFMSEIYGPKDLLKGDKQKDKKRGSRLQNSQQNSSGSIVQTQTRILFNKEFGQLPYTLFDDNHPVFNPNNDFYSFKGTVQHMFTLDNDSTKDIDFKIDINQNFCLISAAHSFQLLETGSQDYTQKQNFKIVSELCFQNQIQNTQIISGKKLSAPLPYIFYINSKQNKLYSRYIKKSKFFGSLQLKDQYCVTQGSLFKWINDEILIVSLGNSLKIYSFSQCSLFNPTCDNKKLSNMKIQQSKPALIMKEFPIFSQHKADILFIEKNDTLKLILTLDAINKIFLLKYQPHEIRVINNFQLRGLRFDEQVTKIMLHKLSIIVCFTNKNRLFAYTFYGQLIGSKQIAFKRIPGAKQKQIVNCIYFFDQNSSSQLMIGTNLGNLWKIDLFEFFKSEQPIQQKDLWFEKNSLNSKEQQLNIKDLTIKRYGRHWEIYTISDNKQGKKIITKTQSLTLKSLIFNMYK